MTTVYKWKTRCETEALWVYSWAETKPTKCPNNSAHTISSIIEPSIESSLSDNTVNIREESTPTGGHYHVATWYFSAPPNTTTVSTKSFPFPISAMLTSIVFGAEHTGDHFTVTAADNTTIGVLMAGYTASPDWVSQNYNLNDVVRYPVDGQLYKCKLATVSNEVPTNLTYWTRQDIVLTCSSTVLSYISIGCKARLVGGGNIEDLDWITNVNSTNNTITVRKAPTHNFSAYTTYVQFTGIFADYVEVGPPGRYVYGDKKIGGTYVPPDVLNYMHYTNVSTDGPDKRIIVQIDYLV
jgi:hypothetical protein